MRISTRTRYGLRLLLRLASLPEGGILRLGEVAREEHISPGYLEQIVRALRPLGILRSVRGSGGGYALSRPASEITMEAVFGQLEGELSPVRCLRADSSCGRETCCSSRLFWQELDTHIRDFLRTRTLQDIRKQCDTDANAAVPAPAACGTHNDAPGLRPAE